MSSKYLLITIIITLCAVGLYQLIDTGKHEFPEYKVSVGQLADFDLVAPFEFPILKSEEQMKQEYQESINQIGKAYRLNPDIEFQAYSNLDKLFETIYEASSTIDVDKIVDKAKRTGFKLDDTIMLTARNPQQVSNAYTVIKASLFRAYKAGIYNNVNSDSILIVKDKTRQLINAARYYNLDQARQSLTEKLDPMLNKIILDNLDKLVIPNITVDESSYSQLKSEVWDSINPVSGRILVDEQIIKKNTRITEKDVLVLKSLTREYQNRGEAKTALFQLLSFLSLLIYVFVLVVTFNIYFQQTPYRDKSGYTNILTLNMGLLTLIGLSLVNNHVLHLNSIHMPFGMIAIAIAVLFSYDLSIFFSVCGVLLIGPFVNWETNTMALLLLSTIITLTLIRKYKTKHEFLKIWIFQFVSLNVVNLILSSYSYTSDNLTEKLGFTVKNLGYSLVSNTIAILGCMAIVSFFEKRWNRATKQVLLELLDFDHPLLKRLATTAVGTYHHSLIVGNLAERAAEMIGANPLLARVGSYYHDIGKVANPEIFTENNEDSSEVHEHYSPEESANLIRNHVREGVVLASKYHIPQAVIDIIVQHHGTSNIRYFLNAARRNGDSFNLAAFSYPGPLPQSKEAALVMLADVIESTMKSQSGDIEPDISSLIEDTIQRLIHEGQFAETPLSLKDMTAAKKAMIPVLESIYRKRLAYPEDKTL